MTAQPFRLADGGEIDRARAVGFVFDGARHIGHPGDTLASALLANGVRLVGRSFKYHRPRGLVAAGPEEPNALMRVGLGARAEPDTRATMQELFDGLVAASQNRFPSLAFDVGAVAQLAAPLIPAGFYYKTFKGAPGWHFWEALIRRAAGLGSASTEPDPDRYERRHASCDVLVIGAGPAGLAAARAAVAAGARVIVCDERPRFGGSLRFEREEVDGRRPRDWAEAVAVELAANPRATMLARTTAFGIYDHGQVALIERVGDHLPPAANGLPRQRRWHVHAHRIVIAAGAIERPLVFADNDRPGVMLASAARRYVAQYAVAPGSRAVVVATNDDAYRTARSLAEAGIAVAAVVDARASPAGALVDAARALGIEVLAGRAPVRALGGHAVSALEIGALGAGDAVAAIERTIDCDLVCVSGGWNPTVHLHSQGGGRLAWDEALAAFVPGATTRAPTRTAGAAAGRLTLADALADGHAAGVEAASACGFTGAMPAAPFAEPETIGPTRALWAVGGAAEARGKRFVDLQNDVTVADVALAHRENFVSVEHLKRYTTLGMGTDQGKTSNVVGLAVLAGLRGEAIPAVGTTTFRPPYTPVALGAFGAADVGKLQAPTRRTPLDDWHVRHGAVMTETGAWLRPKTYPRSGESYREAWIRETKAVREAVGLCDVSTLGKIDVAGPDAHAFLERVYCNGFATLAVGRCRYGLMLREDGMVFDDGTVARVAPDRFTVTTTTANAAKAMQHLERLLEVEWPDLRVVVTSVSDQWAQLALAGPRSRDVLRAAVAGASVEDDALPALGLATARIAGVEVTIFRISFSGERAYEIAAPADHGQRVWESLLAAGEAFGIQPYGLEAMGALRIEKGHVAGPEIDGRATAADLGLGRMVSARKDFLGRRLLERPGLRDPARPALVGLEPADGASAIPAGAILVADAEAPPPVPKLGHVTSATWSPTLDRPIALAFLAGGRARIGSTVVAASPLTSQVVVAKVVDPAFFDPSGARMHG